MNIQELLMNFGFPCLCCGAMAYYVKYISDQHRTDRNLQQEIHKTEMISMIEALNNNTIALTEIKDVVENLKEEVRENDRNCDG